MAECSTSLLRAASRAGNLEREWVAFDISTIATEAKFLYAPRCSCRFIESLKYSMRRLFPVYDTAYGWSFQVYVGAICRAQYFEEGRGGQEEGDGVEGRRLPFARVW